MRFKHPGMQEAKMEVLKHLSQQVAVDNGYEEQFGDVALDIAERMRDDVYKQIQNKWKQDGWEIVKQDRNEKTLHQDMLEDRTKSKAVTKLNEKYNNFGKLFNCLGGEQHETSR